MRLVKYYFILVWLELIILFAVGCTAPKERRGDWMEHMNDHQFNFNAPMIHWDRHNYYTKEELDLLWKNGMEAAMTNLNTEEE